jgi:hypothetical protein
MSNLEKFTLNIKTFFPSSGIVSTTYNKHLPVVQLYLFNFDFILNPISISFILSL